MTLSKYLMIIFAIVAGITSPLATDASGKTAPAPTCVTVDAQFPKTVKMNFGNLQVPIVLTIKNSCQTSFSRTVSDDCFAHSYEVANLEGQIVQHRLLCGVRDGAGVTLSLAPGQSKEIQNTVALRTKLYQDNTYYLLAYQIWEMSAPIQKFLVKVIR